MIEFHSCCETCYRCKAKTWELVGEFVPRKGARQHVVECAFCGVRLRVPAAAADRHERKPSSQPLNEFRFQVGRFKGLTFAEADAKPNGRRYLEVLRDTDESLRERITEYLAHAASSA